MTKTVDKPQAGPTKAEAQALVQAALELAAECARSSSTEPVGNDERSILVHAAFTDAVKAAGAKLPDRRPTAHSGVNTDALAEVAA